MASAVLSGTSVVFPGIISSSVVVGAGGQSYGHGSEEHGRGTIASGSWNVPARTSEIDNNGFREWSHGTCDPMNRRKDMAMENEDGPHSSREQSPNVGDIERERVREIVRGWMTGSGIGDDSSLSPMNESPRAEWLGEIERERVNLVREWVQMTNQQRDPWANGRHEREREESMTDHEET